MARYVDLDKALKTFEERFIELQKIKHRSKPAKSIQHGINWGINTLKELPVEDVIPVAHARWLDHSVGFRKCSNCMSIWSFDIAANIFTNYCPRCGARINGSDDHNLNDIFHFFRNASTEEMIDVFGVSDIEEIIKLEPNEIMGKIHEYLKDE